MINSRVSVPLSVKWDHINIAMNVKHFNTAPGTEKLRKKIILKAYMELLSRVT